MTRDRAIPEDSVMTKEQVMQMIAFLTSSAEISLQEPIHYGTLRLIDASSRLIGFMLDNEMDDPFLCDLKAEIDTKILWAMWDQPAYFQFLRETPGNVATEMVSRNMSILEAKEVER